jgi:hypothetical protein
MTTGRNDPCPCGSGKKYKHCCERKAVVQPTLPAAELNTLGSLFQAGQFADVEQRARVLTQTYGDDATLWNYLAMALQIQGK